MKKCVLVCAAVLLLAALMPRPVAASVDVKFGLKAGVSLANNLWSDDDGMEKMLIRPTFGIFAVFNITPTLAIQPEVNYLTMGEWWSDVIKVVETFNYIHIPVLIKARLMKEGKVVPVIFAGPAIGFLLSAKEAGDDVKEFFKSTDFGADFGAGVEMAAGKTKLIFDARYYLGLTNAYNGTLFSMKNRGFIITAGALF